MTARKFRNAIAIILNLDFDELADAGVLRRHPDGMPTQGGSDWHRLNSDLGMFVLKLPTERLEALWSMIEARQPREEP